MANCLLCRVIWTSQTVMLYHLFNLHYGGQLSLVQGHLDITNLEVKWVDCWFKLTVKKSTKQHKH